MDSFKWWKNMPPSKLMQAVIKEVCKSCSRNTLEEALNYEDSHVNIQNKQVFWAQCWKYKMFQTGQRWESHSSQIIQDIQTHGGDQYIQKTVAYFQTLVES